MFDHEIGQAMYNLIKKLFPLCRSITGQGVRETLRCLQQHIPLTIHEVPTHTRVFDWRIPPEWVIREAYVKNSSGEKIIDMATNNLHVVGYAAPIHKVVGLDELQQHLFSLPEKPNAIPYVTSYYEHCSGFCLTHAQRTALGEGQYEMYIDSDFIEGSLSYGELIISGKSTKEILLSTNICHPSMANNELSGPVVLTFLAKWLLSEKRNCTYRLIFVPETIGSLAYLSRHLEEMKKNTIAGFNVVCVGDDRAYSFLPSRNGQTLADKAALNVLRCYQPNFVKYSFLDRGSDERQYCFPGIDLPVVSIMRTKYGRFPEYHTSLDDLKVVSAVGLTGGYTIIQQCLWAIEQNKTYKIKCLGEPQLGQRGLYPNIRDKTMALDVKNLKNFITYADGTRDMIDISDITKMPVAQLVEYATKLNAVGLLEEYEM